MPSSADMRSMLAELRYYIQDGGDFPCGGIYWWGDLSSAPPPLSSSVSLHTMTEDSFRYLAYYHVCFALASSFGHASFRHSEEHTGEAFFAVEAGQVAHWQSARHCSVCSKRCASSDVNGVLFD
eukprot:GILK01035901.1.p1 GENE.GILK01035901.1~~GILK01035901.1.p1  ORF type:complete len:124 (+),score=4.55 GILK01035901.1:10-381(+)